MKPLRIPVGQSDHIVRVCIPANSGEAQRSAQHELRTCGKEDAQLVLRAPRFCAAISWGE